MIKEITTIVRKNNKAIVYNDDGMFCRWTEEKEFNLDLLNEVKGRAKETEMVLLVTEEEAKAFAGEHMEFGNHHCWTISHDIIWILQGRFEPRANEEKLVNFLKSLQI